MAARSKTIAGALLLLISQAILLLGCSSEPLREPIPDPAMERESPRIDQLGVGGRGVGGYRPEDLNDPNSPLYQRVIYFDYDSSDIRPQFVDILRAHASYLKSYPSERISLEGHTDERGTREYNLALGDNRADTVLRFLLAEGVRDSQMTTMSFGEENPADAGHTESSWALNRRVELVY